MRKPWLYYLVAPTALIPSLRELAVQLGDGGEAERLNFSIPSALASDPLTVIAYGGGTGPVGDDTRAYLEAVVLPSLPTDAVLWVRCHNEPMPPQIVRTSHQPTQDRIDGGEVVLWELGTALATVGMVIYETPVDP